MADLPFETAQEAARVHGFLDSGNYALNYALSGDFIGGGWPLGHAAEIFGSNSTGKSYIIARAIAQSQQAEGASLDLLDDTEGGFNPKWAAQHLGVDPDMLFYVSSDTVKDHYERAKAYLEHMAKKADVFTHGVMALDSLAVLTTEGEIEKAFVTRDMQRAQDIRRLFRVLKGLVRQVPVAYLVTNHTIANIGGWGPDEVSPGGSGLKFHASTRVHLRHPNRIREASSKEYVGVIVNVFVEKNRFGAPWKNIKMAIPFYEPINPYSGLIPALLDIGYLADQNHWLLLHTGEKTGCRTYSSDFLKQDQSAIALMEKYPELIQDASAWLLQRNQVLRAGGDFDAVEEADGS